MIPRISPQEAHAKVQSGAGLLVCAYGSDDTCRDYYLSGALLPSAFQSRVPSLPKAQEIIFYCA